MSISYKAVPRCKIGDKLYYSVWEMRDGKKGKEVYHCDNKEIAEHMALHLNNEAARQSYEKQRAYATGNGAAVVRTE